MYFCMVLMIGIFVAMFLLHDYTAVMIVIAVVNISVVMIVVAVRIVVAVVRVIPVTDVIVALAMAAIPYSRTVITRPIYSS